MKVVPFESKESGKWSFWFTIRHSNSKIQAYSKCSYDSKQNAIKAGEKLRTKIERI
jgi:uncharacterized protein YegP (UPF0339 family)